MTNALIRFAPPLGEIYTRGRARMIHMSSPTPDKPVTRLDQLAEYFRRHPNTWCDAREIARVGGFASWRTRVSDLRRQKGMRIVNLQIRHKDAAGRTVLIETQYRFEMERVH